MKTKHFILLGFFLLVAGAFYMFPKMINQLGYSKYLLDIPDSASEDQKLPLILFLHGSGERGDDLSILEGSTIRTFLKSNDQYNFVLAIPQCSAGKTWNSKGLLRLIDTIQSQVNIDENRIYLTGLSMGGYGTWHLAQDAPEKFAAIAPICGGNNYGPNSIKKLKNTPVWAFHGGKDEIVPPEASESPINILLEEGADAQLTIYPELGHNSWDTTYTNTQLYDWFLSKSL